jgi:mannan endo-1,4-beta-mannosidase
MEERCVIENRIKTFISIVFLITGCFGANFIVVGPKIYDPEGVEFIPKGCNVNGKDWVWPRETTQDSNLIIDSWKFNTIRVESCLLPKESRAGKRTYTANNDLYRIIDVFTSRKIVCIFNPEDFLGQYFSKPHQLDTLTKFFKELAHNTKDNPYVWFDIMGEPGGTSWTDSDKKAYLKPYHTIIPIIRDEVGNDNIIVIAGRCWGQDVGEWNTGMVKEEKSAVLSLGETVRTVEGKRYENIVYDIHVYNQWDKGSVAAMTAKLDDYVQRVHAKGFALLSGEWGTNGRSDDSFLANPYASEALKRVFKQRRCGRIIWSWPSGDDINLTSTGDGGGFRINDRENPSNLTRLGKWIWDDNHDDENLEKIPVSTGSLDIRRPVGYTYSCRIDLPSVFFSHSKQMMQGQWIGLDGAAAGYSDSPILPAAGFYIMRMQRNEPVH